MSKARTAYLPWYLRGSTHMEKNSAPRLPDFTLAKSQWPLPASLAGSKFSSVKRPGVSACVSITRAESWISRAAGETCGPVSVEEGALWQKAATQAVNPAMQTRSLAISIFERNPTVAVDRPLNRAAEGIHHKGHEGAQRSKDKAAD